MAVPLRVLHLVGSPTSAFYRDLSWLYARDCLEATHDPARWEPLVASVTPDGAWRFPADLSERALATAPPLALPEAIARLDELEVDVALPQLFCLAGMTTYRGLLDLLGIPFVGSRADVMALCADKARAKAVVGAAGVAVPAGTLVRPGEPVPADVPLPAVVKPVDADNSLGLTLVRARDELPAAIVAALEHGSAALVEEHVPLGREVRCGTLVRDGELVALPLEEYALDEVRTAADKLAPADGGGLQLMAKGTDRAWIVDPDDPIVPAAHEAARRAHVALGLRHYGLVDLRIDPAGRAVFLEASPYCSFARQSVLCAMAAAEGLDPAALLTTTLAALEA